MVRQLTMAIVLVAVLIVLMQAGDNFEVFVSDTKMDKSKTKPVKQFPPHLFSAKLQYKPSVDAEHVDVPHRQSLELAPDPSILAHKGRH